MSFILYSDCFTHLQHARPLERAKFYFFFPKKIIIYLASSAPCSSPSKFTEKTYVGKKEQSQKM